MMTPRESFEEIARQLATAIDMLDQSTPTDERVTILGFLISAHTHAVLQASSLLKRERAGDLFAMPCPTESLN